MPVLALAACGGAATPAGAEVLERRPYLQKQTAASIVVVWRTDRATDSVLGGNVSPYRAAHDLIERMTRHGERAN